MAKSSCELLLPYYPKASNVEELHSTYIANCVFNSVLSFAATMLNIVTIHAIRKTLSLPKTLKTLLLSLAVSDLGIGLFVQLFYTSILVKWLQKNIPSCITYTVFFFIAHLLTVASFFGVVAVTVDRFLAIHLHLRYREFVTPERVFAVVISIWVLGPFLSSMWLWIPSDTTKRVYITIGGLCFICGAIVYYRIYLVVRHHTNQIQVLQVQQELQNDEMTNIAGQRKSAVSTFHVYLVFLVCYLPQYCVGVTGLILSAPSTAFRVTGLFSQTLGYLNSSLNPVIYGWKMRHIRHAMIDVLRNLFPRQNQANL